MEVGLGSPEGWLFLGGVIALFGWGVRLGVGGMMAPHAPTAGHGHRPGAPAAFDWRHTEALRDLYRVA